MKDFRESARGLKDYVIQWRRTFHQNPELSGREFKTSEAVRAELAKINIEPHRVGATGIIADISGGLPGKTVLLRADMDALPIQELNKISYCSDSQGVMHACGHDCHTAMLLGAAKILAENKDQIRGRVRLVFQPAEESDDPSMGASMLIQAGVMDKVAGCFAIHVQSALPAGKVSAEAGPRMAAIDTFRIIVKGRGGHGAKPHECVDAIVTASALVQNLQTVISRGLNPMDSGVLSIGIFQSGSRYNVIAGEALLEGTIRYFNPEAGEFIRKRMKEIAEQTAAAYGAEAMADIVCLNGPVVNDERVSRIAETSIEKIAGKESLTGFEKTTASEDFGEYLKHAPGVLAFLGTGNPGKGASYSHHHGNFNVDEDALEIGTALYAQFAVDFLDKD